MCYPRSLDQMRVALTTRVWTDDPRASRSPLRQLLDHDLEPPTCQDRSGVEIWTLKMHLLCMGVFLLCLEGKEGGWIGHHKPALVADHCTCQ